MAMALQQVLTERYQLGRLLGSGGMGAVYLAEDVRLRRPVAIKVCSMRGMSHEEATVAADLFQREALTLARLHHPGLTAVWDYFGQGDDWHLVMEYVPGTTLRELLATAGGRLPPVQILDYVGQLCDVLNYLHTQHPPIIFRDLKPGNIMVTPEGTLKLIDFGIARLFSPGKQADTGQFGTPGYAPAEQYGGQTDQRSDVYSLGVVVHQMLTGHNPLGSAFAVPPARAVDPSVAPAVEDVLLRATAYEPGKRFPTVADFCVALRRAMEPAPFVGRSTIPIAPVHAEAISRPLWTPAPARPEAPRQAGFARGVLVVLLLFVLLGSLAGGGWLFRHHLTPLLALFQTPAPAGTSRGVALPGTVVYVAPGKFGEDIWIRQGLRPPEALTEVPAGVDAALPALSPNKQAIAYTLFKSENEQELWLLDLAQKQQRRLLPDYPVVRAASWAPDSKRLVVEVANESMLTKADRDLVVVDVQSGAKTDLQIEPYWEGGPAWSPDGTRVAYHAITGNCKLLYVVDAQQPGSQPEQLTYPTQPGACTNSDLWPAWSPDSARLAFGRQEAGRQQLAVLDMKSRHLAIWDTGSQPARHPRWSPDGKALLFEEGPSREAVLSRLDLTTGEVITLPNSTGASLPDWR